MMVEVSVVIPCLNEVKYIEPCIKSVQAALNHANVKGEIIVVDGFSDDGTRELLSGLDIRGLKVVDNVMKRTPQALNIGIANSSGKVVIILGAHSTVDELFIESNLQTLKNVPDAACVGGVIKNAYADKKSELIGRAMGSSFGVGNARFRTGGRAGFVDTVAFGAYRREVFGDVGFFDELLTRNQDDEFNFRLTKAGHKVYFNPEIVSHYFVRASFSKLKRQYYQYGYWKVFVNTLHKQVTSLRQLAPLALVLLIVSIALGAFGTYILNSFILTSLFVISALIGSLYVSLMVWSTLLSKPGTIVEFVTIAYSFWCLHFYYGIGYLVGIWRFIILRKSPSETSENLTR